jgi:NAD(P)-dependent dehydrogenase (short-subunit alcohol dehydrogenase family)
MWAPTDYGTLEALDPSWAIPDLDGATALVTGAGAGIGKAVAQRLHQAGGRLVICDIDEERGAMTADHVSGTFVRADVADPDDLRPVFELAARGGSLRIVVNNAGGTPSPHFPEADPDHWGRTLAVNWGGVALGTHLAIEAMRGDGGAIVNVSSVAGLGWATHESPEYAAAKAAVNRLTSTLGGLAEEGIRVNAICPDWVAIEALVDERSRVPAADWDGPPQLVPLGAIADGVLRLACDESLAGRVLVCPAGGMPWGLIPSDASR